MPETFDCLLAFGRRHASDILQFPLNRRQISNTCHTQKLPIRFTAFEAQQKLTVAISQFGPNKSNHGFTCLFQLVHRDWPQFHTTELLLKDSPNRLAGRCQHIGKRSVATEQVNEKHLEQLVVHPFMLQQDLHIE